MVAAKALALALLCATVFAGGISIGRLSNPAPERFQAVTVNGTSMEPTMANGQVALVLRDAYEGAPPLEGDIIAFYPPVDVHELFVKRIVGIAGDVVQVKANKGVWINGNKLDEWYLDTGDCLPRGAPANKPWLCETPNYNWGPARVPSGEFFVLGDDRNNSFDSHAWCGMTPRPCHSTWVPKSAVLGRVAVGSLSYLRRIDPSLSISATQRISAQP